MKYVEDTIQQRAIHGLSNFKPWLIATLIAFSCADAFAQVDPGDCNRNEIPDICELNPASNPELCLVNAGPAVPAANNCPDAQELDIGFFYSGTGAGATNDGSATCGAAATGPDVWYKFRNPPSSEDGSSADIEVKFSMSGTANPSFSFDPVLTIYDGCPQNEGGIVACNDDNCGLDSVLTRTVSDGETIFIRIARFASGSFGDFRINVIAPEVPSCIGAVGNGTDCDENGRLDSCDVEVEFGGNQIDCNGNSKPDSCDIAQFNGTTIDDEVVNLDANSNGLIDVCEDCNHNSVPDACDVNSVDSETFPLWQVIAAEPFRVSCAEFCEVPGSGGPEGLGEGFACGLNSDVNENLRPDQCEPDCNGNGIPDSSDIESGAAVDCNTNGRPDTCDLISPLVGTGRYSPSARGFAVEDNYTPQAADMFYLMYPSASGAGRELVGPIGTSEYGAKDVAVNPADGAIVAVGGGFFINGKGEPNDAQNLYTVNRFTGAGMALPAPVSSSGGVFGLTFSTDGAVAFGSGFGATYTLDPVNGGAAVDLPLGNGGIGLATSSGGEIYSLIPQTIFPTGLGLEDECLSGVIQRIDSSTGEVLEEKLVVDTLIDVCGSNPGPRGEGECLACRQLQDIAFGADGIFYGVTSLVEFNDGGPAFELAGPGNDLVRLVATVPGTPGPGPTPTPGFGGPSPDSGYELETVGPLFLLPTGLGGGLPPGSIDCDGNSQPDECQADCDGDGVPDSCDSTTGIDACGVCLGDGASCACTEASFVTEQGDLDGSARELKETVHLAAHTLEQRSRNNRRNKRFARDSRRKATDLYTQAWEITWGRIPATITTCTDAAQCATVSNEGAKNEYRDAMNGLRQLVTDVTKRLSKTGVRKKKTRRLNKTADAQLATAFAQIEQIPSTSSDCS